MKYLIAILAALVCLPCLLMMNESEYIWPNLVGLVYTALLVLVARKTAIGRRVCQYIERLTE